MRGSLHQDEQEENAEEDQNSGQDPTSPAIPRRFAVVVVGSTTVMMRPVSLVQEDRGRRNSLVSIVITIITRGEVQVSGEIHLDGMEA